MIQNLLYQEDLNYINSFELPWNKLNEKSIIVTGGTGLIGSALVDALLYRNQTKQSQINIWVLSRSEKTIKERFGQYIENNFFHYINQDVCEKIIIESDIDYIVHGAGKGDPYSFATDPVGIMNANYQGMYRVLELAREKKAKKVVYISSGEIYGNQLSEYKPETGVKEEDYGYVNLLIPRSGYASSKRAAETLCSAYIAQYGIDVSIARPCHTYGIGMLDSDNRVVGEFLRKAKKRETIVMKSQGLQERSYCYVTDTVTALLMILLKGENGRAYNIANKESVISIRNLARILADKFGLEVIFEAATEMEKKGFSEITQAVLDPSQLEMLGWRAGYQLKDGLYHVVDLMKKEF